MIRVNGKEAAEMLGVTPAAVREFTKMGWLVGITNSGERGPGRRYYYDRAEVEAFRDGGAPAAKAYREGRDLQTAPKRGRGKVGAR